MCLCIFKWNHKTAIITKMHSIDPLELYSFRDLKSTSLHWETLERRFQSWEPSLEHRSRSHTQANTANYFEFTIELITSYTAVYPGLPICRNESHKHKVLRYQYSISRSLPAADCSYGISSFFKAYETARCHDLSDLVSKGLLQTTECRTCTALYGSRQRHSDIQSVCLLVCKWGLRHIISK